MADNWEDLLNEEVIVLEKKVENGTKGFDDEDKEHKSKVPEKLPVEEEPRDSVPKVFIKYTFHKISIFNKKQQKIGKQKKNR